MRGCEGISGVEGTEEQVVVKENGGGRPTPLEVRGQEKYDQYHNQCEKGSIEYAVGNLWESRVAVRQ